MKKHWKVGIVYNTAQKSLGHHGTHFSFTGLPDVEITLADPNGNNLEERMKKIGATRHFADYHEMLEKEELDIVTVCSRLPGDHYEVIETAAKKGCHILCEKPLAGAPVSLPLKDRKHPLGD